MQNLNDLLIRRARFTDNRIVDIVAKDGKITLVEEGLVDAPAKKVIDLMGKYYVSAGWIDSHTHCFSSSPYYYDDPDKIGADTGVTTVVDAGSVGADDINQFYSSTRRRKTHVYAFLNVSRIGLNREDELSDMYKVQQRVAYRAMLDYPDFIVGLKARMSRNIVAGNSVLPLERANEIRSKLSPRMPIMVHLEDGPPELTEITQLLEKNDILTHCFNNTGHHIIDRTYKLKEEMVRALERGVVLDVGHDTRGFSFNLAEQAMKLGIFADMISSGINYNNRVNGPVYSLGQILTKFLTIGYSLEQVIERVTIKPAQILGLKSKGAIEVGLDADMTIFSIKENRILLKDGNGEMRTAQKQIVPLAAIGMGKCYPTKEGIMEYAIQL